MMFDTDRGRALALAGTFLAAHLVVWGMDAAAYRAAEAEEPAEPVVVTAPAISYSDFLAARKRATEAVQSATQAAQDHYEEQEQEWEEPWCDEEVPLPRDLQLALWDACEEHGVPVHLALGVIEVESDFDPDEDNGVSYGLMQLNRRYFPDDLTPAENIRAGVEHLGKLLGQYGGDVQAALRAYNLGYDDGDRRYVDAVLSAAEKWSS